MRGRYSWLITIVTANVPTTAGPTTHSAIAPGIPPTSTKARIAGGTTTLLAINTGRRPKRSAAGPASNVPIAPVTSMSASRWAP